MGVGEKEIWKWYIFNEDLARLNAVSAGQMWVRNLVDKKEI